MFFSIIIPVQKINEYVIETCEMLKRLDPGKFETIIFPDEHEHNHNALEKDLRARIIPSARVSPAIKRDMAIRHARGEVFAFIDDDAYPEKNWLSVAERYLKDESVAAIGGPQLTPPQDTFWQKVSGAVFLSPLSGAALIRYWPGKKVQEVDDWPTVNFIIKRDDFIRIGGFDSQYWPGEDTKLCLDIIKDLRKKILYVPDLIVYHHRRPGIIRHLRQIGNYGLHRGYFAKVYPETSRKWFYFIPSLFVIYIATSLLTGVFLPSFYNPYITGLCIYLLTVLTTTLSVCKRTRSLAISIATIPYIILTHIWYGIRFIQGFLFTKTLTSKLSK